MLLQYQDIHPKRIDLTGKIVGKLALSYEEFVVRLATITDRLRGI